MLASLGRTVLVESAIVDTELSIGEGDDPKTDCLQNAKCENVEYRRDAFLHSRAGSVTKSLGNRAGLQTSRFYLIN